jgi:hypothetical protein
MSFKYHDELRNERTAYVVAVPLCGDRGGTPDQDPITAFNASTSTVPSPGRVVIVRRGRERAVRAAGNAVEQSDADVGGPAY